MAAKVLIVGGAGYIGSAVRALLRAHGHETWVLDDLSTGRLELIRDPGFVCARAGDRQQVLPLLKQERFDCVMHFAAKSLVAESVEYPELYHENNVLQTRALLEMMLEAGVKNFVFSSTCAIFGNPGDADISEGLAKKPINPYGETKLAVETMLGDFATRGLSSVALRYFNAAGAEPGLDVGEWHTPETHLIPKILQAAVQDRVVEIFGTDYPTPDGTCIRDYIHVSDLAAAHEAAMLRLLGRHASEVGSFEAFNLGSEKGYSVKEIFAACEKVLGRKLRSIAKPRRAGDPPRLVANSALARKELQFHPRRTLEDIIGSAWGWEQKRRGLAAQLKAAVFLDRDGTLNADPGYIRDPDDFHIYPGVLEGLAMLQGRGLMLVMVSNQSGVGRGWIKPTELQQVHAKLTALLAEGRVRLDHLELCLHHPDENCGCRKPSPKLLLDAARKFSIDLHASYMVGDKALDLASGRAAGCRASVLVRTGYGLETEKALEPGQAAYVADGLREAARWILKDHASTL